MPADQHGRLGHGTWARDGRSADPHRLRAVRREVGPPSCALCTCSMCCVCTVSVGLHACLVLCMHSRYPTQLPNCMWPVPELYFSRMGYLRYKLKHGPVWPASSAAAASVRRPRWPSWTCGSAAVASKATHRWLSSCRYHRVRPPPTAPTALLRRRLSYRVLGAGAAAASWGSWFGPVPYYGADQHSMCPCMCPYPYSELGCGPTERVGCPLVCAGCRGAGVACGGWRSRYARPYMLYVCS